MGERVGAAAVNALGDPDIAALSPAEAVPPLKPIAVRFDHPTFAAIDARALAGETSFAEQVRRLVAFGLQHSGEFLRSDEGGKSERSVAGDADVADRADPLDDGPVYLELRARGRVGGPREDEVDFLAVLGWLLRKNGFESFPSDTHPVTCDVILPAGWRDLPIVRAALDAPEDGRPLYLTLCGVARWWPTFDDIDIGLLPSGERRMRVCNDGRSVDFDLTDSQARHLAGLLLGHDNAIYEGGAACGSPDGAGIAVTGVSAVSAPSGDLAGDEAHAEGAA